MTQYSRELAHALRASAGPTVQIREVSPESIWSRARRRPIVSLARMVDQYLRYQLSAPLHQGDVNHVTNHGYAHLVHTLDARRTVVTVHDLITLRRWGPSGSGLPVTSLHTRAIAHYWKWGLERAAHVIADSDTTRRDILELSRCPEERVTVIPPGLAPHFRPAAGETESTRSRFGLPSGPLLLHVGHCGFYKNIEGLVRILAILVHEMHLDVNLVRVGTAFEPEQVVLARTLGVDARIRHLGGVSDSDLPLLYQAADTLLFPSLYEGFGWPPLEAMACGTPVVCSDAGSLPEVVGDAALTRHPRDHAGHAMAVQTILRDPHTRANLRARGLERAAAFTWQDTARRTLAVYERVLHGAQTAAKMGAA